MNDYPILRNIMDLARQETWQRAIDLGDETIARWLDKADLGRIRRVYFIGAGTSCYAGEVAKYVWEHLAGIPCEPRYAFDLARYAQPELLGPDALLVAISTSGETGTVLDALRLAEQNGAQTLAVTAYPESAVAHQAQGVVLNGGDDDLTPAKSKSYNQTLVSLYLLGLAIGKALKRVSAEQETYWRSQISLAAEGVATFLETQLGEIDALVEAYASTEMVFMLASGPNLGTIHEGALKVIEMAKMYSEPTEMEDFLHGRYREVDQVTPMFFVTPQGPSADHLLDVLTTNVYIKAPSIVFTDVVTSPMQEMATQIVQLPVRLEELATPLLTITPLHYFAHQMAVKRGWDPVSRRYEDVVPARVKYGNLEAGLVG